MFILDINISWDTAIDDKDERVEIYNYKQKDAFEKFVTETNDNQALLDCFANDEEDLNLSCNKWLSILNTIIQNCFKKIRIKKQKVHQGEDLEKLFKKKEELKTFLTVNDETENEYDNKKQELDRVVKEIGDLCGKKNKDMIEDYLGDVGDGLEGFNQAKTWALKKRLCPKNTEEPPMAKKDLKGNLITDKKLLEKLYSDTYVDRLKPNDITPGLENLEKLKEYLFQLRYENCKTKKSEKWTTKDLEKVLKRLKYNKARDAHGHIYELFKFGGKSLKESLLRMCNKIKDKQIYPDIFKLSNITSLYKKKGEKSDLNNDRGIFNVVKIRSILDKLVYNDKSSIVDGNMSSPNSSWKH